ncbi:MAG: transporter [Rhodospirillales bacterium]|nr:transporter [Rhodospirillales bacterium]
MTPELTVEIREKRFPTPDGMTRTVLHDISFRSRLGEFIAIVGPSGCGKTTLLNIVAGLDTDFSGAVLLDRRRPNRVRIGYVFQQPRLLPWRTVLENVMLVLPEGAGERARRLLQEVGLGEALETYPSRLSIGMARRAAIARAFIVEPELLVMDEPFVSLDAATADRLRLLLLRLWRSHPTGALLVTHDLREAVTLADRILLLSDAPGRLLADVAVPLARHARTDAAAIERIHGEIAAEQRRLFAAEPPPQRIPTRAI